MSLSRDDIKHLAELARLEVSDEELTSAQKDLGNILEFVNRLQNVNTDGVEPVSALATREWRADVSSSCDEATRGLILSNFPERTGDILKTPGVFERPKGK